MEIQICGESKQGTRSEFKMDGILEAAEGSLWGKYKDNKPSYSPKSP